ncbi:MAG: hypothetical protein KAR40_05820 [Candidatus Sabulitectum sp.]|nr:hypothetical protein [Candidatus Sabulitectum sp.]
MFPALLILLSTTSFVPIEDFAELDAVAGPADFGFLLIMSGDSIANKAMAIEIVQSLEVLETGGCTQISLYCVSMNASGYSEMAELAGKLGGFPSVVSLVGHCGFLELDPEFLASEIEDAWYRWGDGSTQGICNYCTRCNP